MHDNEVETQFINWLIRSYHYCSCTCCCCVAGGVGRSEWVWCSVTRRFFTRQQ